MFLTAVVEYKTDIEAKVNQLMTRLAASDHGQVDFTELSAEFAFDVMGLIGYTKDFGNLSRGRQHEAIKDMHNHMTTLGRLSHAPWILYILGCIPSLAKGYNSLPKWTAERVDEKLAVRGQSMSTTRLSSNADCASQTWKTGQQPKDILSYLVNAFQEKSRSAPPSRFALDEDSGVVTIAGR